MRGLGETGAGFWGAAATTLFTTLAEAGAVVVVAVLTLRDTAALLAGA